MITLCKFVLNDKKDSTNVLVTKTFGKHGVLDRIRTYDLEKLPSHNEWWYCEVVMETGVGTPRGVWILAPLYRVERVEQNGFRENDITHLFPGFFTSAQVDNTLLLYPNKKGPNWICGNSMRRHLMLTNRRNGNYEVNSIVVVFDEAEDWPREPAKRSFDPGG
jgi:hypothetical protein